MINARASLAALGVVLAGSHAVAGSPEPVPVAEPIAIAPAPAPALGGDWTGGYVGLSLGTLDVDGSGTADGDDATFGIHGGYMYDFGQFVLGGELEIDGTDVNLNGAANVDQVNRLKIRGGYDLGRTLIYATAGIAEVDTSLGSETGGFGGIGVEYQINDRFYVGGELLEHRFEDIGSTTVNADATSLSLRGGIRF